jgi:hypothetical protein
MCRVISVFLIVLLCLSAIACGSGPVTSNANTGEKVCDQISDTPTEAYKRLYAAVKEKNTERIKGEMSKSTQEFADSLAGRQNRTVDQVYVNGFTATTFAPTLPVMRDERVTSCWGALEVRNDKDNRWEDLPFVNEGGFWKLAVGEMFSGAYQSPGKGMDMKEREAANTARGNVPLAPNPIANVNNINANTKSTPAPKFDGPEVERLPKNK